ncbi:MAG: cysteine-rich CWC family protein [Burkholderiales bacterium]|nr:cysteine-rich CWC family protein [Burkholderiales bacterium]
MPPVAATPTPAHRCPRCGESNDCVPARSGDFATPCWCTTVTVRDDVLASLPAVDRDRACLCRRCATTPPGVDLARPPE